MLERTVQCMMCGMHAYMYIYYMYVHFVYIYIYEYIYIYGGTSTSWRRCSLKGVPPSDSN